MIELREFVEEANRNYEEVNWRMIQLQEANQAISLENKVLKTTVLVMEKPRARTNYGIYNIRFNGPKI